MSDLVGGISYLVGGNFICCPFILHIPSTFHIPLSPPYMTVFDQNIIVIDQNMAICMENITVFTQNMTVIAIIFNSMGP